MPPINKGTNASKLLASQRTHPLQSVCGAVGIVYELPKKWECSLSRDTFLGHRALGCSDGVGSQGSYQLAPDKHRYALTLARSGPIQGVNGRPASGLSESEPQMQH